MYSRHRPEYCLSEMHGIGHGVPDMHGMGDSRVLGSSGPRPPAGFTIWYDLADVTTLFQDTAGITPVTTNGDTIRRINDKSTNHYDLVDSAGGNTWDTGTLAKPSLLATNASIFNNNSGPNPPDVTIYCVVKWTADSQAVIEMAAGAGGVNTGYSLFTFGGTLWGRWQRNGQFNANNLALSYPAIDYYTYLWDSSGPSLSVFRHQTQSTVVTTAAAANTLDHIYLLGLANSAFGLAGNVGEVVVYSRADNPTQRAAFWSYIGTKWSL